MLKRRNHLIRSCIIKPKMNDDVPLKMITQLEYFEQDQVITESRGSPSAKIFERTKPHKSAQDQ
jgi:hypothetical protein